MSVSILAATPALAEQQGDWKGPFSVDAKWTPFLDVVGSVGTKRSIGQLDLFVPFGQTDRTLLFGDARFTADDQNSLEGNFGLGLRHMLPGGWNVGAYGYFDRRRTPTFNSYSQLTFGAEMLGLDFDLRANTYWPIGQTSNVVGTTPGGPPTAAVMGAALMVTFPGSTTSTEYAMTGFDAEAGVRVPIFDTAGPYDLRFYAGGYRFSDGMTPVIAGPRLRLEFTNYRIPELWGGTRLMAGVEWQYDDVRGSQGFATLRLRVPLQGESGRTMLSYQERRMTDPIVRDIDIVSQIQAVTAPTVTEAATATANGNSLTVINAALTGGANLPTAVTAAGVNSTVVLSGTFNTTATVALQSGQTVVGSGPVTVRTASGRTATVTPSGGATIASTAGNGSGSIAAVFMANNSTLSGMTVTNTSSAFTGNPVGVMAQGVSGVTITGNTISVTSTGGTAFGVRILNGATNATVTNNSITAQHVGANAVALQVASTTGDATSANIAGNTLSATGLAPLSSFMLNLVNAGGPVTVSGTGNAAATGQCRVTGAITGSVGFTNGTTCP